MAARTITFRITTWWLLRMFPRAWFNVVRANRLPWWLAGFLFVSGVWAILTSRGRP